MGETGNNFQELQRGFSEFSKSCARKVVFKHLFATSSTNTFILSFWFQFVKAPNLYFVSIRRELWGEKARTRNLVDKTVFFFI